MGRTAGSGRGSIYKRGDKWRGQITIDGRRYSHTARKKADVIKWMKDLSMDDVERMALERNNITVQELAEKWLDEVKQPVMKYQTYKHWKMDFRIWLYPTLGETCIQDLTKERLEKFYEEVFVPENRRRGHGEFATETVKGFATKVKLFLEYAINMGIITKNPHDRVVIRKRKPTKKVDAYTESDQKKIIENLKSEYTPFNAVFYLMLSTGLRLGEATALKSEDVDLKGGFLNVSKTAVDLAGSIIIQDMPKTEAGFRTIFLSANTLRYLKKYIEVCHIDDILFPNHSGKYFHPSSLRARWAKRCAVIGIEYKGPHALRHSFATRALEKGIDIKTVSHILGHKNVTTTMDIYQDVFDKQKQKAADVMNDLF